MRPQAHFLFMNVGTNFLSMKAVTAKYFVHEYGHIKYFVLEWSHISWNIYIKLLFKYKCDHDKLFCS